MLNPSTADETMLDPTIRRCLGYSKDWGYGALAVANIFAFRSTDPKRLAKAEDPIGPENDWFIRDAAEHSSLVICGWGAEPFAIERAKDVVRLLMGIPLFCLELTKLGHPKHPLYAKAAQTPQPYSLGVSK